MKKFFPTLFFSLFGMFSCKGYGDLAVAEFEKMLLDDGNVQLVDVRTPDEFADGHIAGAVNINWFSKEFLQEAESRLDKDRPVMVYCRSGRRSAAAATKLESAGFKTFNLQGGILAWTAAGKPVTQDDGAAGAKADGAPAAGKYEVERFLTDGGEPVDITLIKHGSLEIRYKGLSFQVDPVAEYGKHTDYAAEFPKADVILVTHEHPDHLEDATIATLTGTNTLIILNQTSRDRIGRGESIANGGKRELPGGVLLEAVPAYNTTPGREKFHPKGNGNGYVLTLDGLRIYIAGDTEDIPEMADLKDIDIAFLPVNQPYTMTLQQCVAAAKAFTPKVLIPYHFSQTDLSGLPALLPGIDVRLRQMQ